MESYVIFAKNVRTADVMARVSVLDAVRLHVKVIVDVRVVAISIV